MLSRREMLAATSAAAVVAAAAPAFARSQGGNSLDALAARRGRHLGSAAMWAPPGVDAGSVNNPNYAAVLERECSILVPENQLKWQWVRRGGPGSFDFRAFDALLAYAENNGFKMRGHTLFWTPTKWYPKWLAERQFRSPAEAEQLLVNHVQTVCRRYRGKIYSYDVVNEAIQPETGEIRDTNVTRAIGGEKLLDLMFHTARAEAPDAELVYNDYMSWEAGGTNTHAGGVLRLLEGFRKRGTPVDTLGVQSHIKVGSGASVAEQVRGFETPWRHFLDAVTAMGYKLKITEFDVNDQALPTDAAIRDRMVADYAKAYLDLMMSYPQLNDMLCWGMCDRYSWLNGFAPRKDGTRERGTPYDVDFRPKPLRQSIADAFLK
ncbi:MAG TPA: endo-1,4-beta-xylanase [Sphingomicrobium sp.]|nr:endo-1,4-beta-xylanase [Sphingomicrobium sp.]